MKKTILWIVGIVIIIALLWFFLDHRSGYPKSVEELQNASSTTATTTVSSTNDNTANTASVVNSTNNQKNFMHTITIDTNKGKIVFETYDADAPKTVENFITLAQKGFYNNLIFHRVINGFMIQGGDPTGTGMGGPGYKFDDELNADTVSYKEGYARGVVAMANSGPNTNGSQFFIMQKDNPLPHNYSIFGKVISGLDVVDAIASVKTNSSDKPIQDVVMKSVTVAEKK